MQSVAQGWLALELSNSAFVVGAVSAAGSAPVLIFTLFAGVVADRYHKLQLVKIAQVLMLIQATALWWFTWSGHMTVSWLVILAAIGGTLSAFEIPARQALIVELVGKEDLVDAIALNSGGFNLARIVGPSLAAMVIATAGLSWCFAVNALSFLFVLAGLALIHLPPWERLADTVHPVEGMKEGFAYIQSTTEIRTLIKIIAVYSIFGLSYLTLMPVVARDVLHTGAAGYGFLLTAVGIGALLGALGLAMFGRRIRRGRLFAITAYAFALSILAFALVPYAALAIVILVISGCTMLINGALANGMLQHMVPDALRGRVMAAYVFVYVGLTPIGSLLLGAVARLAGVQWAIGLGATVMLAHTAWELHQRPALKAA